MLPRSPDLEREGVARLTDTPYCVGADEKYLLDHRRSNGGGAERNDIPVIVYFASVVTCARYVAWIIRQFYLFFFVIEVIFYIWCFNIIYIMNLAAKQAKYSFSHFVR